MVDDQYIQVWDYKQHFQVVHVHDCLFHDQQLIYVHMHEKTYVWCHANVDMPHRMAKSSRYLSKKSDFLKLQKPDQIFSRIYPVFRSRTEPYIKLTSIGKQWVHFSFTLCRQYRVSRSRLTWPFSADNILSTSSTVPFYIFNRIINTNYIIITWNNIVSSASRTIFVDNNTTNCCLEI